MATHSPPTGARAERHEYQTIQALRATAALAVVVFHAMEAWQQRIDETAMRWANGSAGVDLFFVVSGFVMLISSRHLADRDDGWHIFLIRRLIRIVPLYWLMTTVKLLLDLAFSNYSLHGQVTEYHAIASYLFIPSRDGMGNITPILAVGWTLSYEMLFYLLFAAALFLRVGVLKVLVPTLGILALISPLRTDSWPAFTDIADPLGLEFVAGVCLAMMVLKGQRLRETWAWSLLCVGLLVIATIPEFGRDLRALSWGLPAAVIVACAVSLERRVAGRLPSWLTFLGDSSYSIYLVHFLVTSGSAVVLANFGFRHRAWEPFMILFCLVASAVLGGAVHILIERPLTERLKRIACSFQGTRRLGESASAKLRVSG